MSEPVDIRQPVAWLNYPSAVVPDPYKPMGPNLLGELLWPVDIETDTPNDGWTRVGFSLIAPPGVRVEYGPDGQPVVLRSAVA